MLAAFVHNTKFGFVQKLIGIAQVVFTKLFYYYFFLLCACCLFLFLFKVCQAFDQGQWVYFIGDVI